MNPAKPRSGTVFWCAIVALLLSTGETKAATLALFNTGVNGTGTAWAGGGVPDIHYNLVLQPGTGGLAQTVTDTTYPFGPWLVNNSGSRWIGPAADAFDSSGLYAYRQTFFVPSSTLLSSVFITGRWATDDTGTNIRINGTPTGNVSTSNSSLTPFSIGSGFSYGVNTLDFIVNNAGFSPFTNATGLRVDDIFGAYQTSPVPEPHAVGLAVSAVFFNFTARRRHLGPRSG
jgi:hypothetical protein